MTSKQINKNVFKLKDALEHLKEFLESMPDEVVDKLNDSCYYVDGAIDQINDEIFNIECFLERDDEEEED